MPKSPQVNASDSPPLGATLILQQAQQALQTYFNGEPLPLDFPMNPSGTAFQQQVWAYLKTIGYGQTLSYSEVAAGIGKPKAVRAVANACAANPLSLFIPCHRVLRSDGTLRGYRWGLPLKKALLQLETDASFQKKLDQGLPVVALKG